MSELILHGFPVSTYVRTIRMACHRKGLEVELRPLKFRTDAHAALHPWKKMPILEHGEVRLFETLGIQHYLDHLAPEPRLVPDDPVLGAVALQWTSAFNDYVFHPALSVGRAIRHGETIIEDDAAGLRDALQVFDRAMGETGWLVDDEPRLPDLLLFPIVNYLVRLQGEGSLLEVPNIRRAHAHLAATPAAQATVP